MYIKGSSKILLQSLEGDFSLQNKEREKGLCSFIRIHDKYYFSFIYRFVPFSLSYFSHCFLSNYHSMSIPTFSFSFATFFLFYLFSCLFYLHFSFVFGFPFSFFDYLSNFLLSSFFFHSFPLSIFFLLSFSVIFINHVRYKVLTIIINIIIIISIIIIIKFLSFIETLKFEHVNDTE